MSRCLRERCIHWSFGCTTGDEYLCRMRRKGEASMDRMPWIDWRDRLVELAEEEGYFLGNPEKYREYWREGKSPEATLEELEE